MAGLQVGFQSEPYGSLEWHLSSPGQSLLCIWVPMMQASIQGSQQPIRRLLLPVLGVTELKGFTETDNQGSDRLLWVLVAS